MGVRVLAEMAGHASIQTTQRYIDVNDEQMRSAAELIWEKSVLTRFVEVNSDFFESNFSLGLESVRKAFMLL